MTATPAEHLVSCDIHPGIHDAEPTCVMAEEIPAFYLETPATPATYLEDSIRAFADAPDLPF